jgi:hypothetical protein
MTKLNRSAVWLALAAVLLTASCGGGGVKSNPGPNPGFTRMVATVTDATGAPLKNLNVRVEGRDTGVLTDNTGQFALTATAFPNGVNASNELSFGKNGIVLGTKDVVPAQDPTVTIRFAGEAQGGNGGTASVSGTAYGAGVWNGAPGAPVPDANGNIKDTIVDPAPQPLDGVQVTLFSADKNEVYQTTTSGGGKYSFDGLEAGDWQLAALLDGYYPQMAGVSVADGAAVTYDFTLTANGTVPSGTGFKVGGTLKDSKTGAPIAGATVSLFADTGYTGIYYPDTPPTATNGSGGDPAAGYANAGTTTSSPDQTPPGTAPIPPDASTGMPCYRYDPQYQTTTTAADGSFTFPDDVVGYSLWLSYSADGYLAGNTYQDISGQTSDLDLSLTMDPLVPASISGHVTDGNGNPVEGAEVDFVFASGGGVAMPGYEDFNGWAADGKANYDSSGNGSTGPVPGQAVPPTPTDPNGYPNGGGGATTPASAPEASGSANQDASSGGSAGSGSPFNSLLMQSFLWEQKQKGSSAVSADFNGFASAKTDANGDYTISDIPAGHYYIMAGAYKHLPYGGEADLAADPATNTLDITLPAVPVGSVEGTVTDASGNPVPDALVNATQPFIDPFSFTDASGHYRIDNVPTGDWTISAFKSGYVTSTSSAKISENGVAEISLTLNPYTGQDQTTASFAGTVQNGSDNSGVAGASLVFTPVNAELGGYYASVTSGADGGYSATLVPDTEYTLLIQKDGFNDMNVRVWTDSKNPQLDFWLWPAGANGGWPVPQPAPAPGSTTPNGGGAEPPTK